MSVTEVKATHFNCTELECKVILQALLGDRFQLSRLMRLGAIRVRWTKSRVGLGGSVNPWDIYHCYSIIML